MPYINRDQNNQIIALYTEPPFEGAEHLPTHHDDIIAFLNSHQDGDNNQPLHFLTNSDYELVRVLEDLIELLIDKNQILFTELPAQAQKKLVQRRGARQNLQESDSLMINEDDIL